MSLLIIQVLVLLDLTPAYNNTIFFDTAYNNTIFFDFEGTLMGHRHIFGTSQMFENEPDQNWNHMHIEQPYTSTVRAGPAENGSFYYPTENISADGLHFAPQWNPAAPMPNAYVSSNNSIEMLHHQPDAARPYHDPSLHSAPGNHAHHAASSSYDRQPFSGVEGGLVDLGRGPHKRKSPGVPPAYEGGSTIRFYGAGSSSDPPLSSEPRQEKPNSDPQYMAWECITMNPGHQWDLSIRPESAIRNVRNRPAIDLESNLARTHLSNNSYPASLSFDHSGSVDISGQNPSGSTNEWSHTRMPYPTRRLSVSDASSYNHEQNQLVASSITNAPIDIRGYHQDFVPNRNPTVPQNFHGASTHSIRGVRSSYRPSPTFRTSSSSLRLGHAASSDDGVQLVSENYSRQAWRNGDRNGRSRISYERYRSMSNDRYSSEGFMVVDRSALYGSRSMFDRHRDMRLDVDSMSYEELLALGERIGSVNTGLSEDLVSKCMTETVYCSSSRSQDEGSCVICLEEYKEKDEVGSLKNCGHNYHVSCIKKWLSMKNSCPICKACAVPNAMKEQ